MKIVVFTDLDATLLDSQTYSWEDAREALEVLKARRASLVLVSSKTFAEMAPLHRELQLDDPFVVENGGGILIPPESLLVSHVSGLSQRTMQRYGDYLLLSLGTEYESLVQSLVEISDSVGLPLVGFSSMTESEVAALTGLDLEEAGRARTRLFDEPFLVQGATADKEAALQQIGHAKGLIVVPGGRFWHLIGHAGKAAAVAVLIEAYRSIHDHVLTIGLGDSPNDFCFLELVDRAVLVGAEEKVLDLPEGIRDAYRTESRGPRGWNQAVLKILSEIKKPGR